MNKTFFLVLSLCLSLNCAASLDDLDKAVQESDLQMVQELSKILTVTDIELVSLLDMAREVVEHYMISDCPIRNVPSYITKKYGFAGKNWLLAAAASGLLSFASYVIGDSSRNKRTQMIAACIFLPSMFVPIFALFAYLIKDASAIRAIRRELHANAIEIRKILIRWPSVQKTA